MILLDQRTFLTRVADYLYGIGCFTIMLPMLAFDSIMPRSIEQSSTYTSAMLLFGLTISLPFSAPFFILAYIIDKVAFLRSVRKHING